jgi:hypothetical protein
MKKRERIIGLVVGLIGLITLWWFRFDRWEFVDAYKALNTPMGKFIYNITSSMMSDLWSEERNRAEIFWYITQLIYIGAVWYYRACIGHWVIKSIRVFYKKI